MPTYTPIEYDPFSGQMPGKNQDRVVPGPAIPGGEGGPEADVSRGAPNLGAPILSSAGFNSALPVGQPTYTPVDYDPFERAALRTQKSVRPPGGRQEGALTSLPEDLLVPKTPLDYALYALGGPLRAPVKAAMLAAGGALSSEDAQAGPIGMAKKGAESIAGAAVKIGEQLYKAPNHFTALQDAAKQRGVDLMDILGLSNEGKAVDGFVTSTGRFVDRKEADRIAGEAGQKRTLGPKEPKAEEGLGANELKQYGAVGAIAAPAIADMVRLPSLEQMAAP